MIKDLARLVSLNVIKLEDIKDLEIRKQVEEYMNK